MWRVAVLAVRNDGLTPEAFNRRWLDDFCNAVAERGRLDDRLRRLIGNVRPLDLEPGISAVFPPRFDGLLEFWFETSTDAVAVMRGLSDTQALLAAAEGLVNPSNGVAWLAEVFPKKPENGHTRVKFLAAGDAAAGWTVEAAQNYWSNSHPVVAQTAPKVWEPLTRYVQFHGRDNDTLQMGHWLATPRPVPLCSDMGFARSSDFLEAYTNEQYLGIVRPDEEKFSRPGDMLSFVSHEERMFIQRPMA